MKAWLLDRMEGIPGLRLAEVPDPHPGAGEVVLNIDFAALNPADRYLAEGQYPARPPMPHILGRDAVGTVVEVGTGVTGPKPGDKRAILRGEVGVSRAGTFAQRTIVPVESLVEIPDRWSEDSRPDYRNRPRRRQSRGRALPGGPSWSSNPWSNRRPRRSSAVYRCWRQTKEGAHPA